MERSEGAGIKAGVGGSEWGGRVSCGARAALAIMLIGGTTFAGTWPRGPAFRELRRKGGAVAGVPPFTSDFPAVAARSSKVQYYGRKRRSCSPS